MADVLGDLLRLVERTELGQRLPARALQLWALDCARRALGVDIRPLDPFVRTLQAGHAAARALLREPDSDALRTEFDQARQDVEACRTHLRDIEEPSFAERRAVRAVEATLAAMDSAIDRAQIEATAVLAREAFLPDDRGHELDAQIRRLLLRCGLLPSGEELLVRLDYAESRGALPADPAQRAWIDAQRERLMANDTERRLLLVIRHLEQVFLDELERARPR